MVNTKAIKILMQAMLEHCPPATKDILSNLATQELKVLDEALILKSKEA